MRAAAVLLAAVCMPLAAARRSMSDLCRDTAVSQAGHAKIMYVRVIVLHQGVGWQLAYLLLLLDTV